MKKEKKNKQFLLIIIILIIMAGIVFYFFLKPKLLPSPEDLITVERILQEGNQEVLVSLNIQVKQPVSKLLIVEKIPEFFLFKEFSIKPDLNVADISTWTFDNPSSMIITYSVIPTSSYGKFTGKIGLKDEEIENYIAGDSEIYVSSYCIRDCWPGVCGDNRCTGDETCSSCSDCGSCPPGGTGEGSGGGGGAVWTPAIPTGTNISEGEKITKPEEEGKRITELPGEKSRTTTIIIIAVITAIVLILTIIKFRKKKEARK